MKIICIAASIVPSITANSIQVVKAAHALKEIGHDVILMVPGEGASRWDVIKTQYGLKQEFDIQWINENQTFRRYDFAFKAVQKARKLNPDLIYTWVLQASVFSLWWGIPTILELHDRVTGKVGPWLFLRFWGSQTNKRLLTNTEALKNRLIQTFKLADHHENIIAAPNGVELERFKDLPSPEASRHNLGLPQGFTAAYTGHFYAGRGMALMFELAKGLPDVQFLWVGGHPEDVLMWETRVKSEGLLNLQLTGFIDNAKLPFYQAAADVLLMPYGEKIEGSGGGNSAEIASPMKMFEYMAAGRAIISSDLSVIHEVLDESMAVFCPPGDFPAWRAAILSLKADKNYCKTLGKHAQTAVQKYSWKNRAKRALEGF